VTGTNWPSSLVTFFLGRCYVVLAKNCLQRLLSPWPAHGFHLALARNASWDTNKGTVLFQISAVTFCDWLYEVDDIEGAVWGQWVFLRNSEARPGNSSNPTRMGYGCLQAWFPALFNPNSVLGLGSRQEMRTLRRSPRVLTLCGRSVP
jgi:hypothetical protein